VALQELRKKVVQLLAEIWRTLAGIEISSVASNQTREALPIAGIGVMARLRMGAGELSGITLARSKRFGHWLSDRQGRAAAGTRLGQPGISGRQILGRGKCWRAESEEWQP